MPKDKCKTAKNVFAFFRERSRVKQCLGDMDVTPIPPASRYTARSSYGRGEGRGVFANRYPKSQDEDQTANNGAEPPALDQAAQSDIRSLAQTDREVRSHEAAHLAAAGSAAQGGAKFIYKRGPDGKYYAVGGEVRILISSGNSPEETIQRARQVRSAALAPSNPSSQDMAVAAQALAMETAVHLESSASHRLDAVTVPRSSHRNAIAGYHQAEVSAPRSLWALA
jgi:hypothetical protein